MDEIEKAFNAAGFVILKRDGESVKVESKEMKCQSSVSIVQPDGGSPVQKAIENCERWLQAASGKSVGMGKPYVVPHGQPIVREPCATCGLQLGNAIGNIAHGIWGLAKFYSGLDAADQATVSTRLDICGQCMELDSKGDRIARIENGEAYCGAPLLQKADRDFAKDGCGCPLKKKTAVKKEKCPRGRW